MAIPILRIMTMKSKLGSGKYRDYTLEDLFNLNKEGHIYKAYFVITNVSFNKEILDKLGLTPEYQIQKPGSNWKLLKPTLKKLNSLQYGIMYHKDKSLAEKQMTFETKNLSKSALQHKNQKKS